MKTSLLLLTGLYCICTALIVQAQPSEKHGPGILSSAEGYQFMVGFMQNEVTDCSDDVNGVRYISILSKYESHVTVRFPGGGSIDTLLKPFQLFTTYINWRYEMVGEGVANNGIEIEATRPVSVYCFSSRVQSSDGYLALPISSWGTQYITANYYLDYYSQVGLDSVANPMAYECSIHPRGGEFAVIAAHDSTVVTVIPRTRTAAGIPAGAFYTRTLRKGDIFQVQDGGSILGATDLTGSTITSNYPVGVLSGHIRTGVPVQYQSKDHLIEMLPPRNAMGKRYMAIPLGGRRGGDLLRIISATLSPIQVTISSASGSQTYTIPNPGSFIEYNLQEPAVVTAQGPVLAVQYSRSNGADTGSKFDPDMIVLTPEEQFINSVIFQTMPSVDRNRRQFERHFVTIVGEKKEFASIELNGRQLITLPNLVTGDVPGVEYRWAIAELPDAQVFTLTGDALCGGYVYGMGDGDSYAWPLMGGNTNSQNSECTPKITPSGTINLCGDNSVQLDAGMHQRYAWSTGDTTRTITVTSSGVYSVTTFDSSGCAGTSAPVTVKVVKIAPVLLAGGGPVSFCAGDSITLTLPPGFASYHWSTGDTVRSVGIHQSGEYWAEVRTEEGCKAMTDTLRITVHIPATPVITDNGNGLTTNPALNYQWYRDGVLIPDATTQSIKPRYSGQYTVRTVDSNGCAAMSDPFTFIGLGVEEDGVSIPLQLTSSGMQGHYSLDGTLAGKATVRIELVDMQGRRLMNEISEAYGTYHRSISLEDVPAGSYLLRLHVGTAARVWHLVRN